MASKTLLSILALACLALTAAGCSSDNSPATVDTMPPAVPSNLDGEAYLGTVTLSWAPNTTDADFAGFKVDRTCNDVTVHLISQPQNVTSVMDSDPPLGYNVYAVTAVDRNGNESAYATLGLMVQFHHPSGEPGME